MPFAIAEKAPVTSVQPSPPLRARPGLALTALAAVLAGFGLGTLALGLARPVPEVSVLPAPAAPDADLAEAPPEAGPATPPWPAAFGEPPPPAPAPAEPEAPPPPRETRPPPEPEPEYSLRGIITDPDGGWVLAEGPMGVELVRLGGWLSGGERVTEITRHGVVLEIGGEYFLIEFEEDDEGGFGSRPGPARHNARGFDDEFDEGDHDDRPRRPGPGRPRGGGLLSPGTP